MCKKEAVALDRGVQALRASKSPAQSLPEVVHYMRGCVRRKAPGTSEEGHARHGGAQDHLKSLILP